ncbi:hypothetical protein [Faecalicatena orotica]|uniref:hypothetical protein n=1 Tax=Faecalicatena orotica TaxID=1544 RepID=UPI0032168AA5
MSYNKAREEKQMQLIEQNKNKESTKARIKAFRKRLSSGEILESFDRVVFESVVERIMIGGYNDEGVEEPLKITFVYKTGIHSDFNGQEYQPKPKITYKMIQEYVEMKYEVKVHTAYIAEVKRSLGLIVYDAPNVVEKLKQPRKHPPVEKIEAIKDALKYSKVI